MKRGHWSMLFVVGGAAALGWAAMAAAVAAVMAYWGGSMSGPELAGWGAVAAPPAGLAGWVCAAAVRRAPAATWPLAVVPGGLLVAAAVLTATSAGLGPMPWDHPKAGPLLAAGLLVLAGGPTFVAGAWARWATRPRAGPGAAPDRPRE
jgi:hypothetical protein